MVTDREAWLAETVIELVDVDFAAFDETAYAYGLALRLAELASPAEVGVLLHGTGDCQAVAAGSSERAAGLAFLQARGMPGPAADACGAACTVAMRCHDETVGAITLLGPPAWTLAAADAGLAELLAEVAAITIARQRALELSQRTARQLQQALDSRVVIEQAKGATAARLDIATGQAFELLRSYSRRASRPLSDVAADVVRGVLPVSDLAVPGRRRLHPAASSTGTPARGQRPRRRRHGADRR